MIRHFWKSVEYSLATPETDAAFQRVFSITNGRTKQIAFSIPTIKAIKIRKIISKNNPLVSFITFLLIQPIILNAIGLSRKYNNDTVNCNEGNNEPNKNILTIYFQTVFEECFVKILN